MNESGKFQQSEDEQPCVLVLEWQTNNVLATLFIVTESVSGTHYFKEQYFYRPATSKIHERGLILKNM